MSDQEGATGVKASDGNDIIVIGNSKIRLVDAINYLAGRTDEAVFVEEGRGAERAMRVSHVPLIIFVELSQRFGVGELKETPVMLGTAYQTQLLDKSNKSIGFPGAIGIRVSPYTGSVSFALWSIAPKGEPNNVFETNPLLDLCASTENAGVWAYGKGHLLSENIRAKFSLEGISVRGVNIPALRLLALVLYRVHQLVLDPTLKAERFWEADKCPGEYTEPD